MKLAPRLAVALTVLFGLGYPVGALAVEAMTPGAVLVIRFTLSAAILTVVVQLTGRRWPRGRALGHVAVVGLLIQAVQFIGCYEALQLGVSPVLLALVIAMNPLATSLIAAVALHERISRRRMFALVLAVVAVVTAFAGRLNAAGGADIGVVAALIALLGLSAGSVYQQRFVHDTDPIAASTIGIAVSIVPAVVFAAMSPVRVHDARQAVLSLAAMVIFSSVICMTLYVVAVRRAGAAQVAMLFAVIPSVSAVLSWVLLGTRPGVGVVIGLAVGAAACVMGREPMAGPRPRANARDCPQPAATG